MPKNYSYSSATSLNEDYKETPPLSMSKKSSADMNDGKTTELVDMMTVKYKCDKNVQSITMEAGSTVPLMEAPFRDAEADDDDYTPYEHRKLTHPTSDMDTFIHLLKGSLGSGILAMPRAIWNAGLLLGFFSTFAVGAICTYCIHILVRTSQELCKRNHLPSLGFAETAEAAFLAGPPVMHKYSRLAKAVINTFLVLDLLGCCCVYVLFVAKNIQQVVEHNLETSMDLRVYMALLLPFLIVMNLVRNLKYLSPFSMVANILIGVGIGITFYYLCIDLPPISSRPYVAEWHRLPSFFGTVIFALEGIGVVMPLENNMRTPHHFIGCPGVLNFGMSLVISMYAATGFLGYLKYGEETDESITLNLPKDDILAQSVKLMIAIAIFLTYSLQFYVPIEIIWKNIKHKFPKNPKIAEYTLRATLVSLTVGLAIALPNLGPFITLIGAVCLSTLGMIFPAVIELVTFWNHPKYADSKWFLFKNYFLMAFGFIGFVTGTYVSIQEFSHSG